MNKYEFKTLMGIKALRRLGGVKVSAWVRRKHGQSFVCLCVKSGWMKSLSVPRISERLAKLDQWQSHSVYRRTHAGARTHTHRQADSHTYQLCSVLPQWQGHCHTPFRCLMKTHRHAWLSLSSHKCKPLQGKQHTATQSPRLISTLLRLI